MKKLRKIISVIMAALMLLSLFTVSFSAYAASTYVSYKKIDDYAVVSGCSSAAKGVIEIDSTYEGVPVKEINASAFENIPGITGIVVPASVTKVGNLAFANCPSLQNVEFEGSECTFGNSVFRSGGKLSSVTLPSGLTSIPKQTFFDCSALIQITIPASVTTIGSEAFATCSKLTKVTIPASVTSIGSNAFIRCQAVESYNVASGNTTYKSVNGALYDITGRTLIQYPGGSNETSVTVAPDTKIIGNGAFAGNRKIESVTFPESLETIEDYAFQYCENLGAVTLPPYIKTLGKEAFGHCTAVKSIELPSTLTTYEYSFYMAGLESVTIKKGAAAISRNAFEKCDKLTSVSIPDTVKTIGVAAFIDCKALESISVPASVTSIGNKTFSGCNLLIMTVVKDSAAHTYAKNNSIRYTFENASQSAPSAVAVRTQPAKTVYEAGESVSIDGLTLFAEYADGTSKKITEGIKLDSVTRAENGKSTVTVSYGGKTVSFEVTVNGSSDEIAVTGIEITKLPTKLDYNYKDKFSRSGMIVIAKYSDGSQAEISGYTVTPDTFTKTGSHTVTVEYEGFKDTVNVSVSYSFVQIIILIFLLGFLWY